MQMTQQQRDVVEATGPVQVVIAGPGTGKTFTMVEKIASLIAARREPECITAVSFTRNAAAELRERTIARVGKIANGITFGTCHALALKIVRDGAKFMGLPRGITVYDEQDRRDIIDELRASLRCTETMTDIMTAVRSAVTWPELSIEEAIEKTDVKNPHKLRGVVEGYVDRLRTCAAIDLDGIIPRALWLLATADDDFRDTWRRRARVLIVDEYHDTSPMEAVLYKVLEPREFIVVGDPRQEIYAFRGTTKRFLEDLTKLPMATVRRLTQSFRSCSAVVNAANNLISHNVDAPDDKIIEAHDGGSAYVVLHVYDDGLTYVRDTCRATLEAGKSVAVLSRTNHVLDEFARFLKESGTPIDELTTPRAFMKLEEVRAVHAAIRAAFNPRDMVATTTVCANWPGMPRPRSNGWFDAQLKANETGQPLLEVLGWRMDPSKLSVITKVAVDVLVRCYTSEGRSSRIANVEEAGRRIGDWITENGDDLEGFVDWLQHREIADRIKKTRTTPAVEVGTIHAAKGLEWDVVIIVGAHEEHMPHGRAIEEGKVEEERRLAYVAVTRARTDLHLMVPTDIQHAQSRFINEMYDAAK